VIESLRNKLDRDLLALSVARESVRAEGKALAQATVNVKASVEAQALMQEVAVAVQSTVHSRIASVVTRCLEAVWGSEAYQFKIEWERKRGRTEAAICLVRDGNEVDPLDGAGGGCCDVVSWAAQIASIMLARPKLRRLYVGDESFRHVSAEYRPAIRTMIQQMATELGFQMIFVTHSKELMVGKVIEIGS
jgi:predicted ATPase